MNERVERIRYLSIAAACAGTFLHFTVTLGSTEASPTASYTVAAVGAFLLSLGLYFADRSLRRPDPARIAREAAEIEVARMTRRIDQQARSMLPPREDRRGRRPTGAHPDTTYWR